VRKAAFGGDLDIPVPSHTGRECRAGSAKQTAIGYQAIVPGAGREQGKAPLPQTEQDAIFGVSHGQTITDDQLHQGELEGPASTSFRLVR
jgi:hypothetical protein